MLTDITINLFAEDTITFEPPDSDGDVRVTLHDDDPDYAASYIDREAAQDIITALTELHGLDETPEGTVRASDISLNEALIRVAAVNKALVTFRYVKSAQSPVETRTFVPAQVKNMGDHVTFVGEDDDRGAIRSFRSDRIRGTVQVIG